MALRNLPRRLRFMPNTLAVASLLCLITIIRCNRLIPLTLLKGIFPQGDHSAALRQRAVTNTTCGEVVTRSVHAFTETISYRFCSRRENSERQRQNEPRILIGILSMSSQLSCRNAIRESWGRDEALVFVVSEKWAIGNNRQLEAEIEKYGDLLWLDAEEHYKYGMTNKTKKKQKKTTKTKKKNYGF